jgi:hypothetical protein
MLMPSLDIDMNYVKKRSLIMHRPNWDVTMLGTPASSVHSVNLQCEGEEGAEDCTVAVSAISYQATKDMHEKLI